MKSCSSTPISWLRLEQYQLGDLDDDARSATRDHLATCEACRATWEQIAEDDRPLPQPRELPVRAVVPLPRRTRRWQATGAAALAAAAAWLLFARPPATMMHETNRTKGAAETWTLVREDGASFSEEDVTYRDGDRFRVRFTCSRSSPIDVDLAVFGSSAHEPAFPIAPQAVACGNDMDLRGAFRVSGEPRARICLLWNEVGAVDRARVQREGISGADHAQCKTLRSD